MPADQIKVAVGIATLGRRDVLTETLDVLSRQIRPPDLLVISGVGPQDVDEASLQRFPAPTVFVTGPAGLCAQRNRILSSAADSDIVVFFDDDFFAEPNYLVNLVSLFQENGEVVAATGVILADGIKGPGLSVDGARKVTETASASARKPNLI